MLNTQTSAVALDLLENEFDAALPDHPYGWLKYFLAPMEDGKFKGADDTYTIGRAIFVFAGGTAKDFNSFVTDVSTAREAKGPDFISRLKAHLNILPLNEIDPSPSLLLRRAILLRSALETELSGCITAEKTARIDGKVIDAFLKVKAYKHGNRSLKAIVQMASLENGWFHVASLASKEQLDMHVDDSFLKEAGVK